MNPELRPAQSLLDFNKWGSLRGARARGREQKTAQASLRRNTPYGHRSSRRHTNYAFFSPVNTDAG